MKIAVASGKGGTGKTTFVLSLSQVIEKNVIILDCDVEEPNLHLFLKQHPLSEKVIKIKKPVINESLCVNCGLCSKHCQFNAIINLPKYPLISNELCHSCGVCEFICPQNAISEVDYQIGKKVFYRKTGDTLKEISLISGVLDIGQIMAAPLINQIKQDYMNLPKNDVLIIDSPPGASCSMFEAIKDMDYIVLVTEPTPFGLHDLKMAVNAIKNTDIPYGVFINKADIDKKEFSLDDFCNRQKNEDSLLKNSLEKYCKDNNIKILGQLAFEKEYAKACATGIILSQEYNEVFNIFSNVYTQIKQAIFETGE
ncbi:MAG: ATP-binding protein [Candidatus Cloacimonetes bacterium]|nr:ATP-binding protein [Candidatus Cloacimonadota bacterium]